MRKMFSSLKTRLAVASHSKRLTQSKFVRNVAVVATGTAGGQAITMASAPIITRLYGPEAFGVLGAFTSILLVLSPLAALSYPIAIVLPKRDAEAIGLAKLSLCIAIIISLITALILIVFKAPIVRMFSLQSIEAFIMMIPLAMFFTAAMTIMSQWLIRKKLFKISAKVAVIQSFWLNISKVGVGLFAPVVTVLIVLATLGSALHAIMLWIGARKSIDGKMTSTNFNGRSLAWTYRDFACYRTPQIVLNAASLSMPVLMLASFFGPATAGFYALGKMIVGAPSTLISQSIVSVFYPRINEAVNSGENAYKLLVRATFYLAAASFIPFLIIIVFGPGLFAFAFGGEWHTAGVYAQWLALWSYFGVINRPSLGAIPVLKMQGFFLMHEIIGIGLRALSLLVGFLVLSDALAAIAIFSLMNVVINVFLVGMVFRTAYKIKPSSPVGRHS